jgi:hypothetical protein
MLLRPFRSVMIIILLILAVSCSQITTENRSISSTPPNVSNSNVISSVSDNISTDHGSIPYTENNDFAALTTDYYKALIKNDGTLAFLDILTGTPLLNGPTFNCNYGKNTMSDISPINSSFEIDIDNDSIPDNWNCSKNYITISDEHAIEGQSTLLFNLNCPDNMTRTAYSSSIKITSGKIYAISIDSYYLSHVVGTLYAYVVYYNTADGSGTPCYTLDHLTPPVYDGKWYTNTYTFVPPYGALSFKLGLIASADSISVLYWDNVVIKEITKTFQTNGGVTSNITTLEDNISIVSIDDTNTDVTISHKYDINTHSPSIKYTSTLTYKNPVTVDEERFDFIVPSVTAKVMTRDIALVPYDTSKEYYSDGLTPKVVKFSNGVYFTGNDNFQSMVLKSVGGQSHISYYSDYYLNHPFFLYAKDSGSNLSLSTDVSKQHWSEGYNYCASVTFMINTRSEPHLLVKTRQPYGYDASIIFTNHTDQESVDTINAVFYGTEDITSNDYGLKGLVSHDVGITKTVWMNSADNGPNHDLSEAHFKALHDKLYADSIEIGPHSTTPQTEDRTAVAANLDLYRDYFGSTIWIDHGPSYNNWEDISVAGSIKGDPNYILDLLDQYGYKYAWNGLTDAVPYNDLNMFYPSDTYFRMPLLYYNNNVDHNIDDDVRIYLWSASSVVLNYNTILARKNIDKLISEKGVYIAHSYLAIPSSKNYTWYHNEETGKKEIVPDFEANLQYMQNKIITGHLWSPTMSEAGDYWKLITNISIVLNADDTYTITNHNSTSINGLTLLAENDIKSIKVEENSKAYFGGTSGDKKIILPTLNPDESCNLTINY